jgi:hypothetical protein
LHPFAQNFARANTSPIAFATTVRTTSPKSAFAIHQNPRFDELAEADFCSLKEPVRSHPILDFGWAILDFEIITEWITEQPFALLSLLIEGMNSRRGERPFAQKAPGQANHPCIQQRRLVCPSTLNRKPVHNVSFLTQN